jgi:pimeloyl-ACP methyl ester carboxylesterase
MPEVTLDQGTVHYTDSGGDGPTVVLVHGLLVNGSLWRDVVPGLSANARVVVPDLPLGSHPSALREDADLTPPGVARLIADFLAALDLRDVTLVANDTGGAMTQLVLTRHPERVGRVVLTNCDSHENFLPPAFRPLQVLPVIPGAMALVAALLRIRKLWASPLGFGTLTLAGAGQERLESWVTPVIKDLGVRRDLGKVLRGIDKRYTLEAATKLREFGGPALLVWARNDRFFTAEHAQRLAAEFADARIEWVDESRTFVPVDVPARLSELITDFVRRDVASR